MKKKIFILNFIIHLLFPSSLIAKDLSAITYKIDAKGGRFGDHLYCYCKAKWISYRYDIPLFYNPFKYSNELAMHYLEPNRYHKNIEKKFKKAIKIIDYEKSNTHKKNLKIEREKLYLYINDPYANIIINWDDQNFIHELKKMISPQRLIIKPSLPVDRISVAVHVRKGGGYDEPLISDKLANPGRRRPRYYADKIYPTKFPPDSYYINQIKRLYEIFNEMPLYVHIFTDDRNPMRIVKKYKNELNNLNIIFSCRKKGNYHNLNVLEDFFSMTYYDCLIRSASHFPLFADIIGNFFIVISLENAYWDNNKLIVDKIKTKINKENFYKVSHFIKNFIALGEIF